MTLVANPRAVFDPFAPPMIDDDVVVIPVEVPVEEPPVSLEARAADTNPKAPAKARSPKPVAKTPAKRAPAKAKTS